MRPLLALGFVSGCAQIAGIENTSGDGRVSVSLDIERVSIGTTVERAQQDLSGNTANYIRTDPVDPTLVELVPATETEPGKWTADIFDATPPVIFDLPDVPGPVFQRQLTLPQKAILSSFDVLEHPNPTPSALTDTITVTATLDTAQAAETYELFIVGTWTQVGLPAPGLGITTLGPATFEIQSMAKLTGRDYEQITPVDTAIVIRRNGVTLNGAVEVPPFTQGPTNDLGGLAITTLPADQTLSLAIDPTDAITRLSAVRPAIGTPAFSWSVNAAPGAEVGNSAGPLLVSGTAAMTDTMISSAYANPFVARSWPAVVSYVAAGSRSLTPEGETLVATLAAGMQQLVAEPAQGLALDFPAGVVEQMSIGGQSLSTDNVQIARPTAPVEVTLLVNGGANTTLFTLEVNKLVPNVNGTALVADRKLFAAGQESTFVLQPDVFEPGGLYSLRVTTINGLFPNVADGDLRTRALPVATAFVDSGVFRVMQ